MAPRIHSCERYWNTAVLNSAISGTVGASLPLFPGQRDIPSPPTAFNLSGPIMATIPNYQPSRRTSRIIQYPLWTPSTAIVRQIGFISTCNCPTPRSTSLDRRRSWKGWIIDRNVSWKLLPALLLIISWRTGWNIEGLHRNSKWLIMSVDGGSF